MTSSADVAENLATARRLVTLAATAGAAVVALPENFAFMGMREADKRAVAEAEGSGAIQDSLAEMAARDRVWVVGGTVPLRAGADGRVAAACLVFDAAGRRVARYDKIHLFDVVVDATYRESAHVAPGSTPIVVDTPAGRLGLAVCYDVRFPELFRALNEQGAEWFVLPSAFTVPTGQAHWETLLRARAIENLANLVAPAQCGTHANGRQTYGDSMIIDYWGRVLARARPGEGMIAAQFDAQGQREARVRFPALLHRTM
jgi:nitrilase